MSQLQANYKEVLIAMSKLQEELMAVVNNTVQLISVEAAGQIFTPTQLNLLDQLYNWPNELFPIPPAAWVNPRTGVILMREQSWEYVFHGNGVTFTNTADDKEIGVQFGSKGEISLTSWIVSVYLDSIYPKQEDRLKFTGNNDLFQELVDNGELIEIPPRLPGSDQTFILRGIAS